MLFYVLVPMCPSIQNQLIILTSTSHCILMTLNMSSEHFLHLLLTAPWQFALSHPCLLYLQNDSYTDFSHFFLLEKFSITNLIAIHIHANGFICFFSLNKRTFNFFASQHKIQSFLNSHYIHLLLSPLFLFYEYYQSPI